MAIPAAEARRAALEESAAPVYPAASEAAFAAQGAGGNVVLVDPAHDLVVVTRWVEDVPGVVERVVAALR